jgi:hypothetical protein
MSGARTAMLGSHMKSSGMSRHYQKLVIDLWRPPWLVRRMDRETAKLISQLCTKAGMIMEDYSALALSLRPQTSSDLRRDLDELAAAADRMAALINAANTLARE